MGTAASGLPQGEYRMSTLNTSAIKRVLVVDDAHDVADSLSMLVQVLGHEVKHAYDGQAALDLAASFHPDVVFLDIAMPKLDGFAVARQLQQGEGPAPRLVALTGFDQDRHLLAASQAGFSDYVVKPHVAEGVKRILGSALSAP